MIDLNDFDLDELELELSKSVIAEGGLLEFVRQGWHVLETAEFVEEPHIEAICLHTEALYKDELEGNRLLINVPPSTSKTMICTVMAPAWWLTLHPDARMGFVHNDLQLGRDAARRSRQLIESEWYQARFPHVELNDDATKIERFFTTRGGCRATFTTRAAITGWHASGNGVITLDDPNRISYLASDADADAVITFYSEALHSRFADPMRKKLLVVQQRLHMNDLSAHVLAEDDDNKWTHLCLPAEYEPSRRCETPIFSDWRKEAGEPLAPVRWPQEAIDDLKKSFPFPRMAAAQLQQNPILESGNLFKLDYFANRWTPDMLPDRLRIYHAWDCTFNDSEDSDYVVGQTWGIGAPSWAEEEVYFLLDQFRARMSFTKTVQSMLNVIEKHGKYSGLLIEAAAGGHAALDVLEAAGIEHVIPVKTGRKGKFERASSATWAMEQGFVYWPAEAPWFEEFQREMLGFPAAKYDDCVDTTAMFINHVTSAELVDLSAAWQNAAKFARML